MTELLIKTIIGQARQLQRMDTQACDDLSLKARVEELDQEYTDLQELYIDLKTRHESRVDELLERNADLQAADNKPHLEPSWKAAQMYKEELAIAEERIEGFENIIRELPCTASMKKLELVNRDLQEGVQILHNEIRSHKNRIKELEEQIQSMLDNYGN